ncbi:hypothetical protein ACFX2C_019284 [Malus domestica]
MLDPLVEVEGFARRSKSTIFQNIRNNNVCMRNNIAEEIHITPNWKMHNIGDIFQSGGKLSLSTNEGMGLCTPPSNHVAKKFGLKLNNMLLNHEDGIQNFGPCRGRTLVRKAKLKIYPICPASGLAT